MISLQEKTIVPRDGFSYYYLPPGHPEAAFTIPNGTGYTNAVKKLMAYRAANPWLNLPSDEASVRHEIEVFTFARLKATGELGVGYALKFFSADASDDAEVAAYEEEIKKNNKPQPRFGHLQAAVGAVGDFTAIYRDWLGDGMRAVEQELAEKRSHICETCPQNKSGNWFEQLAATVANAVHLQMEAKNYLKLRVSNEDRLHQCAACKCALATKVFVPLKYITDNTRAETMAKLDPRCWMLHEAKA